MKKLIALVITFTLLLSTILPAMALAVTGQVNVSTGGGEIPLVKCKWEQQPFAVNPNLEDGDSSHTTLGFQLLPPGVACATKTIEYYAVVTDEEDGGTVSQVFADVYHPVGSPEPYGPSKVGGIQNLPYFKYEIPFVDLQPNGTEAEKAAAIAIVNLANLKKLIILDPSITITDVITELEKGTAHLWMGQAEIDYEQPAGLYDVYVAAVDTNNNPSAWLHNQFTYVAVATLEYDFLTIDWGSVNLGKEKMVIGDLVWNKTPGTNGATVRNVGNTWASVTVKFDDMGFGQDVYGNWNVNFDARMGNDNAYYVGGILPYQTITLDNALGLSTKDELDLSIKIIKGFGAHKGVITLGQVARKFAVPVPASIVGFASPESDCPDNGGSY